MKEGLCESTQFEGLPETYELLTSWVLRNSLPDFLSLNELPQNFLVSKSFPPGWNTSTQEMAA